MRTVCGYNSDMSRSARRQSPWQREDRPLSLDELQWLRSPVGQATCREMALHPADTPAAIAHWRQQLEPPLVSAAWNQVCLRKLGERKFARAGDMLFDRTGLEQATDEVIAVHKACRFAGIERIADLCCGIGGDTIALAGQGPVVAVDWSPTRVELAHHNAGVYEREIAARVADASVDWPEAQAVHIDPDRRAGGTRSHRAEAGSPDLASLVRLVEHYRNAAIKLSPGADLDRLPLEAEIEIISHHGECKQAVVWTGQFRSTLRRATILPQGDSICAASEGELRWPAASLPRPQQFLHEPDSAVIRANLVGVVATRCGLIPVDPRIAYLVSDKPVESCFVTSFRILDIMPWSGRKARAWLNTYDIGPLEVKTRGFAAHPDEILRQIRPAGRKPGVLFLTRLNDRPTAILAERCRA